MNRAGSLIRRSSTRLKSLSKGHSELLMVISQLREVRKTFKAFVVAQLTLSEDLVKWSSTLENEAIHSTFTSLSELGSLWAEVQKDLVDSLKEFRHSFDLILEGEKHVDQAKQNLASREEAEKNTRKELQKAYNKASCEEIQVLRECLNRSEKVKELARFDVVDRVRENEAVRMIRVKEGVGKLGSAFVQMSHRAGIIFGAQELLAAELPDVHDRAIHNSKYKVRSTVRHLEEAKERLRFYNAGRSATRRRSSSSSLSYHDPPPPYSPSFEKLNDSSNGGPWVQPPTGPDTSSNHGGARMKSPPSAPKQSTESLVVVRPGESPAVVRPGESPAVVRPGESPDVVPPSGRSNNSRVYPSLTKLNDDLPPAVVQADLENPTRSPLERKPERKKFLFSSKRRTKSRERKRETETNLERTHHSTTSATPLRERHSPSSSTPSSTPPSCASPPNGVNPEFSPPPPYNPFYEWSEFPPTQEQ